MENKKFLCKTCKNNNNDYKYIMCNVSTFTKRIYHNPKDTNRHYVSECNAYDEDWVKVLKYGEENEV